MVDPLYSVYVSIHNTILDRLPEILICEHLKTHVNSIHLSCEWMYMLNGNSPHEGKQRVLTRKENNTFRWHLAKLMNQVLSAS